MNETRTITDAQHSLARDEEAEKPALSFESVTFSNGGVLTFDDDEIVVFVGPNNAGKSAALREMQQFVSKTIAQTVVKDATFRRRGSQVELWSYLDKHALKVGDVANYQYAGMGYNIHH